MALVLKSSFSTSNDGTELYIEFRNATGDYDVDDNPGGFGAPNLARNAVAVLIYAQHKLTGEDQAASISAYNFLTVESFTIAISEAVNGIINSVIFAIPIFDDLTSYDEGDIVYDNENPSAPFIKELVGVAWVERALADLIANEDVIQDNQYRLVIPDACLLAEDLNATKLLALKRLFHKKITREEYLTPRDNYEYVEGLIRTANRSYKAHAYNEAQIFIEEIFSFNESLN